jgi:beta-glucanase (GH16 family)
VIESLQQNPEKAYLTYHCNSTYTAYGTYITASLADGGWHTYSVQWTPNILIWYIDGVARFNVTQCVPNLPMYLLANMAIGGWPGPPNATTPFPNYMDVDYIRAYKYVSSGGSYLTGPGNGIAYSNATVAANPRVTLSNPIVVPETASPGSTVQLQVTLIAGAPGLTNSILTCNIYHHGNNSQITTGSTTGITLAAGVSKTFTFNVVLSSSITKGYYRVAYGVFNSTWGNYYWQNAATAFGVNSIVGGRGEAGWQQNFAAEFNSQTSLSSSVWNSFYHYAPSTMNNELQFYAPDAFSFGSSSYLRIAAQQRSYNGKNYTSGVITTKNFFTQTYGYFEIRARFPSGKGFIPIFKLGSQDTTKGNSINVVNSIGDRKTVTLSATCASSSTYSATVTNMSLADGAFHIYGLQWTSAALTWYVDGVVRYTTSSCLPNNPMYLIAGMAVGGTTAGNPTVNTTFPSYYEIDYVRAYKYVASNGINIEGPARGVSFTASTATTPVLTLQNPIVSPFNVSRGSVVKLNVTVLVGGSGLSNAKFGPRIINSSTGAAVTSFSETGVTVNTGQQKQFSFSWTVPSTQTVGYYTVGYVAANSGGATIFSENSVSLLFVK